ncbi:2'-5' RNA ligase family protein [Candidatus Saccharibacteria bacterium]|nr:2'-5' RNA ligase family protein [Candidatus Saccharibacteria bacterium]
MFYSIIHRPEADVSKVEEIDAKYDPYHGLVGAHVTLLFPVPALEITEQAIKNQAKKVVVSTEPFHVQFNSHTTELSWDQWLFLNPSQGKKDFERLYLKLYEGELRKFLREDIPYSPHIAIGHFAIEEAAYDLKDPSALKLDEVSYLAALEDVRQADIQLDYTATQIELIGVDSNYKKSWTIEKFSLGKNYNHERAKRVE